MLENFDLKFQRNDMITTIFFQNHIFDLKFLYRIPIYRYYRAVMYDLKMI